ncbi:MAG: hypothetical protein EZS28_044439, partial [Streblomastix strix]
DILLNYIKQQVPLLEQNLLSIEQRRAIAATLVMVFTVARLAELHRAVLLSTSEDEFRMRDSAHYVDSNPGSVIENQTSRTKPKYSGGSAMQRDTSRLMIFAKPQEQQCGLLTLAKLTQSLPLELRQLPNSYHNVSSVQVDRFTHHSDAASTVRQYYDKNNNVEATVVLGQIEEELDNEEDEEQERTLLEEIEHERSNVEQRILSHVGVLSPGLSHLEFSQLLNGIRITQTQSSVEIEDIFQPFLQYSKTPTQVVEDQKAQDDAANAEEVARLLDPFNIGRVNKQSKSSLSLEEIVYSQEEYKQSSGRDMSSSFVPPHQDVPTLGNLGQTESSEVQTLSSADEQHEVSMIKEKETDDS